MTPGWRKVGSCISPIQYLAPISESARWRCWRRPKRSSPTRSAGPAPSRTSLPRAGRATLRRQSGRDVLHLLYATPVLRGLIRNDNVQPIQDLVTLADIDASVACERPVASVRLVPGGEALAFAAEAGRVSFRVPRLRGHAMVEMAFRT